MGKQISVFNKILDHTVYKALQIDTLRDIQLNTVIISFTLQISQTRRRTSPQTHSILYMGRTAGQRSWYWAFNKGGIHPDHTDPHEVHCWVPNIVPHNPYNSSHIVQPRYDINFVVSFRHNRSSSLCICEYNTGTVCSINKLTYWLSNYQKIYTLPFDTIISHELILYIWNYSRQINTKVRGKKM